MIEFEQHGNTYVGTDERRRWWRIAPMRSGWLLEYRDPDDEKTWRAGVFGDMAAARTEANREYGPTTRPWSAPFPPPRWAAR